MRLIIFEAIGWGIITFCAVMLAGIVGQRQDQRRRHRWMR